MSKLTDYLKSHRVEVTNDKIIMQNYTVTNPVNKALAKFGLKVVKSDELTTAQEKRAAAYASTCDEHFHAYLAYKELGETEKAEKEYALWIEARKQVQDEYPYND